MKIKRNSWHYKISNLLVDFEKHNDTLCLYFWRLIGTIVLIIFGTGLISTMIYSYFTSAFFASTSIMLVFIISCFILPAIAIYFLRVKLGKSPEITGETIVIEFIKAKKNKICPLIKYTN